jgi:hypothetical protein
MLACGALCAAGLRSVLAAPVSAASSAPTPTTEFSRAREQAFAEAFARAYLSWDDRDPGTRIAELRRFSRKLAEEVRSESDAPDGRQTVAWTAVSRDEAAAGGGRRITVLADTSNGPLALAVTLRAERTAAPRIVGFPAIVGIPPAVEEPDDSDSDPVNDGALGTMAIRALRNFLAGRRDGLAADLMPGSVVVVPEIEMRLLSVEELTWSQRGRAIYAVARVGLGTGGGLTLGYEIGVAREANRWFVRWIETQPTGG